MGLFDHFAQTPGTRQNPLPGVVERRSVQRPPMRRSSATGLTSHLWELELVPAFGLLRLCDDIDDLARRSLDQNIFFETPVLRSAWPRLTSLLAPSGAFMLCLWETMADRRHLRFFMPVGIKRVGLPGRQVLQPLANHFMPIGTPMVDRECGAEATEMLLRLLADPKLKIPPVIDFIWQKGESQTQRLLEQAAHNLGLKSSHNLAFERAALLADTDRNGQPLLNKKRRKELARQLRKLEELGQVEFVCSRSSDSIIDAIEGFMSLELSGWKGRKGTALYNHKKIAAFSRQIVYELASQGNCEIFALHQHGHPVASLIMLGRDGRLVPWKIAYDESLAAMSPGMQIMVHATEQLRSRPDFVEADSIAVANHPMINRLWPDRVAITDFTIALRPDAAAYLKDVVAAKQTMAWLKHTAKSALEKTGLR